VLLQCSVHIVDHICPFVSDGKDDENIENFSAQASSVQNSEYIKAKRGKYVLSA
jgi:hypothetical protein